MSIDITQYRATIGHYHLKQIKMRCNKDNYYFWSFIFTSFLTVHFLYERLLRLANDIGENPGPPSTDTPITICQMNCRSLVAELDSNYKKLKQRPPKVIELETFCRDNNIDILALTETWCNDSHSDDLIKIADFTKIYRKDRLDRQGGGVAVYASNNVNINRLKEIEPSESEIMCFELQIPNKINKHAFLCVGYRPQDKNVIDFTADFLDVYEYTNGKGYFNFLSVGDFNCKHSSFCQTDKDTTEGSILRAVLDSNGLSQLVDFPTRFDVIYNRSSCIDFIITNESSFVKNISSYGPVANCDHIPVAFQINAKIPKQKTFTRHVWNFKKGDFDKLNQKLAEYPWDTIFIIDNIDDIVDTWTDVFLDLAKECIPYSKIIVRPDDLPYMTSELRSQIRKKDRLFKQWQRTKYGHHRNYYTRARNAVGKALRLAEANYITKECDNLGVDHSNANWWSTVKKLCCFRKASNTIAPIVNAQGILVYDAETKADIFNEFYASVSTIDNYDDPIPSNNIATGPLLENITILQNDVYEALTNLNTSKATGPDNIGNMLLKRCAPSISGVLTRIFNLSLSLGIFPRKWKIAHIVPIHKKGSVHDFKMYRPVSLLPCVSKVFEKLIFKEVYLHLRNNGLLSEFQSGFTPGDSTINQLIHINDMILKSMDNYEDVIGCFLDLTRAFDTVWHKGLLYKLDKYGIRDHANGSKLHTWFTSYLTERGHKVSIDGKLSSLRHINAAVPQGSVLGPLLFLVYINDVTLDIDSEIFLFADDTSIFKSGKDTKLMAQQINSDLNKIALWAKRWKININPTKTVSMLFSKKSNPDKNFQIRLNSEIIQLSDHHKHLGLWLSSDATWTKHINESALKARKRLGCVQKHKYRMDRRSIELIYLTFVRPLLEYGSVLFDSATNEDLDILTEIEKEALRIITGARKRTNLDLLYSEVKWPSLENRKETQKVITLGKIIIEKFPSYLVRDLPTYYGDNRSVRNNTFAVPKARTDYYKKSFVPDSIDKWNKLPNEIRSIKSHKSLKYRLKTSSMKEVPKCFYHGSRKLNILHTKLRLGCSDLNADKYQIGVSDTDLCHCGEVENADHYLLNCGTNLVSKVIMIDSVTDLLMTKGFSDIEIENMLDVHLLLRGSPMLSDAENCRIFGFVQVFISDSKRFT